MNQEIEEWAVWDEQPRAVISSEPSQVSRARQGRAPRFAIGTASGLIALAALGISLYDETYVPGLFALCVLGYGAFALLVKPLRTTLIVAIAIDLCVVFAYLWSLDEAVPVTIRVTQTTLTANVGGNSLVLHGVHVKGRLGIAMDSESSRAIVTTGNVHVQTPGLFLASLGDAFHNLGFGPAWRDIVVSDRYGSVSPTGDAKSTGPWHRNRRGEISGPWESHAYLGGLPSPPYTVRAELVRPDGAQGLLIGVGPRGGGYALRITMDDTYPVDPGDARKPGNVLWLRWRNHFLATPLARLQTNHLDTIAMIQRDVRLFLENIITALILILISPLAYLLHASLAATSRRIHIRLRRPPLARISVDAIAIALALVVFLVLALASTELERIPHVPDDVAYLFQAKTFALGRLWVAAPPARFFHEAFILMRGGHWFSKYPPGWPALLAIGVRLGLPTLVNPFLAAISLLLTYLIGKELYGKKVAILGAVLLSISPLFLTLSATFMAHTATLACLLGSTYLALRWLRKIRANRDLETSVWPLLTVAGVLFGWALITRSLDALTYGAPLLLLVVGSPLSSRLRAIPPFAAGTSLPLLAYAAYNWALTGHPLESAYTLYWSFDHVGFGQHIGAYTFTLPHGLWNLSFNLASLNVQLFGWPNYFALALAAVPFVIGRARRIDLILALSIGCVVTAYVAYYGPGVAYGPRYYFVVLPWFALLTARGVQELASLPRHLSFAEFHPRRASVFGPFVLLAGLCTYNLFFYLPVQLASLANFGGVVAGPVDTVSAAGLHNALVFVTPWPPVPGNRSNTSAEESTFSANSPLLNGNVVYATDRGELDALLMRAFPHRHYYRLVRVGSPIHPTFRIIPLSASEAPGAAVVVGRTIAAGTEGVLPQPGGTRTMGATDSIVRLHGQSGYIHHPAR